ncbi:MAG: alpha/beta hydrolase [Saprospiraceae bacterium]
MNFLTRKYLYLALIIFFQLDMFSQPLADRYHSQVFTQWSETTNITFSTGVPRPNPGGGFYEWVTGYPLNVKEYQTTTINLKMNIFQPVGDTLSKRPVIIIAFGGGFLSGSKDHWSIRLLAQELAKRGFVTAVIDYRLGMNIFNAQLAMRSVYRGLQDGRSAVRFFKADAAGPNTYKVDAENIFLGGHSSGGFIALHNAYLDRDTLRPASTRVWTQNGNQIPDLMSLDSVGNNRQYNGRAKAIFSLAGALGYTEYIEENTEPIVTMFHSTDDETVPYESGEPFSNLLWLVVGSNLPEVFGSHPISIQASSVGLQHELHTYSSRGHGVHENGSSALYTDIVPSISNWFFTQLLKPKPISLLGLTTICDDQLVQEYTVRQDSGAYYDWQLIGGNFVFHSPYSNKVSVLWNENAPVKTLSVTPYSYHRARGDADTITVTILPRVNNTWVGSSGSWSTIDSWSLESLPNVCHNVIFPNQFDGMLDITLDSIQTTHISQLYLGHQNNLQILSPLSISNASGMEIDGHLSILDTVSITEIYDEEKINLLVNGQVEINPLGVLLLAIPNVQALKVGPTGFILNHGKLDIFSTISPNNNKDLHVEGIVENLGTMTISNPTGSHMKTSGTGLLENKAILNVKKD